MDGNENKERWKLEKAKQEFVTIHPILCYTNKCTCLPSLADWCHDLWVTLYNVRSSSLPTTDWLNASWRHHSAAAGAGHRDQTGEVHHQRRPDRRGPQRAGGLLLRLHRQMAALAHHQQVLFCCCRLIFISFMRFILFSFPNFQDISA